MLVLSLTLTLSIQIIIHSARDCVLSHFLWFYNTVSIFFLIFYSAVRSFNSVEWQIKTKKRVRFAAFTSFTNPEWWRDATKKNSMINWKCLGKNHSFYYLSFFLWTNGLSIILLWLYRRNFLWWIEINGVLKSFAVAFVVKSVYLVHCMFIKDQDISTLMVLNIKCCNIFVHNLRI